MKFTLRHLAAEPKLCQHLRRDGLEAIARIVAPQSIQQALQESGAYQRCKRERKLNLETTVLLVIAMSLYANESIGYVLHKITRGLRLLQPDEAAAPEQLPGESALVYRRYQLGVGPLCALFRRLCRPLATQDTPGAFLFGLRLMAVDGQLIDLPDTPENRDYFGKMAGGRGQSAFAKVQAIYLCELGTHAIVDAGFWPANTGEHKGTRRLIGRSVKKNMLVLWDRGLFAFEQVLCVRKRGGHVLCRLSEQRKPVRLRPLSDGSWLAYIFPAKTSGNKGRYKDEERLLVRLIEYTLTDPALPGYNQRYVLLTTLLDPNTYPAKQLAVAYHERWEVEVTLDEIETHLHLCDGPLRSKKPIGVLQELYGLLLAHFAVRSLMHEAAVRAGLDPDRLSFTHAVRLIGDAIRDFQMVARKGVPRLYGRLLAEIVAGVLPSRRARSNPRVVKRKMSNFDLKRPEHYNPPKLAGPFREAIGLI